MRNRWLNLAFLLAIPLATIPGARADDTAASPSWRSLPLVRDGAIDQEWVQIGGGSFVVEDGQLRTNWDDRGLGLLLYRKEPFGNCQLRVIYKSKEPRCNSGVFVRIDRGILERINDVSPALQRDASGALLPSALQQMMEASTKERGPWYAVHHGFEVQICDQSDEYHRTGAIYSLARAAELPAPAPNHWRTMVITLKGTQVLVDIDGKRITTFDSARKDRRREKKWYEPDSQPKRPAVGYIGLQNHDPNDVVWFKDVSVRPLPAAP